MWRAVSRRLSPPIDLIPPLLLHNSRWDHGGVQRHTVSIRALVREKATLQSLGRITAAQIEDAEVNHVAPPYRLACQFIARDEDVVITFTGEPGGAD